MKKATTIIKCIDLRQNEFFRNWLKKNRLENSDIISIAGSVKELVGDKKEIRKWILGTIKICHDSHNSRDVVLINHSKCGAYAIKDKEEEEAVQLADMEKAKKLIMKKFPDMKVTKYWLELVGKQNKSSDIIFNLIK